MNKMIKKQNNWWNSKDWWIVFDNESFEALEVIGMPVRVFGDSRLEMTARIGTVIGPFARKYLAHEYLNNHCK